MLSTCVRSVKSAMSRIETIAVSELETDVDYRYWVDNKIHTKPVARSLVLLDRLEGITHIEWRSKGNHGLLPFAVRTATGKYLCKPTDLHEYVKRLQRRRQAAYNAGQRLRKYIDMLVEHGLTIADVEKRLDKGRLGH